MFRADGNRPFAKGVGSQCHRYRWAIVSPCPTPHKRLRRQVTIVPGFCIRFQARFRTSETFSWVSGSVARETIGTGILASLSVYVRSACRFFYLGDFVRICDWVAEIQELRRIVIVQASGAIIGVIRMAGFAGVAAAHSREDFIDELIDTILEILIIVNVDGVCLFLDGSVIFGVLGHEGDGNPTLKLLCVL